MKKIFESTALLVAATCIVACSCTRKDNSIRMLVGTYTDGNSSQGVYLFNVDEDNATFSLLDTAKAGNPSFIIPSPDGRFLYTSHRLKEDGIAVFAVNSEDGTVSKTGYCPTGKHPRNFAITPNGKYLFCTCRDDNRIEIYAIDAQDGSLTYTGKCIEIPSPVCIQFFKQ